MLQRLWQQTYSFSELAAAWFLYLSPSECDTVLSSRGIFLSVANFWTDYAGLFKGSTINYIPVLVSLPRVWIHLCSSYNVVAGSKTLCVAGVHYIHKSCGNMSVLSVQWEIPGRSAALKCSASGEAFGVRMLLVLNEARKCKGHIC